MPDRTSSWSYLSVSTAQLLFCDLQQQIVARSRTTAPKSLSKSAGFLLQIAQLFSLPVTLSVVPEQDKAPELIPDLAGAKGATQLLRTSASPFFDGPTREALAASGRRVLIVGGFAMEVVVLHAVLDALADGYQVLVPVDVCGGMSNRTEEAALRQLEAAGATPTSVVSLATKLAPDFTTEKGKQMFEIVQQLRLS